jgi:hypothetical protein
MLGISLDCREGEFPYRCMHVLESMVDREVN